MNYIKLRQFLILLSLKSHVNGNVLCGVIPCYNNSEDNNISSVFFFFGNRFNDQEKSKQRRFRTCLNQKTLPRKRCCGRKCKPV